MIALRFLFGDILDSLNLPSTSDSIVYLQVSHIRGRQYGDRLKKARLRLGLSRLALSKCSGVSSYGVALAERCPERVPLPQLNSICTVLWYGHLQALGLIDEKTARGIITKAVSGIVTIGKQGLEFVARNPQLIDKVIATIGRS